MLTPTALTPAEWYAANGPDNEYKPKVSWKVAFLAQPANSFFCNIPPEFLEDQFELFGLEQRCQHFKLCIQVINSKIKLEELAEPILNDVRYLLPKAYGLVHSRYIITSDGIKQMKQKYENGDFGTCPRALCEGQPCVPVGMSSKAQVSSVKLFCPRCHGLYTPFPEVKLDGAYFTPNSLLFYFDFYGLDAERAKYKPFERRAFGFRIRESD